METKVGEFGSVEYQRGYLRGVEESERAAAVNAETEYERGWNDGSDYENEEVERELNFQAARHHLHSEQLDWSKIRAQEGRKRDIKVVLELDIAERGKHSPIDDTHTYLPIAVETIEISERTTEIHLGIGEALLEAWYDTLRRILHPSNIGTNNVYLVEEGVEE